MIKILFVCHGNICRSPMAEYVFKDMVRRQGMEDAFEISSAATSREEIGNGVHPGTRRKLKEEGIPCGNHRARQMTGKDYAYYDYLIGMEQWNLRNMYRLAGVGPEEDSPKKILAASGFRKPSPRHRGSLVYRRLRRGLPGY